MFTVQSHPSLECATPASRAKLSAKARQHAEFLIATMDKIDERQPSARLEFAQWIIRNYQQAAQITAVVVCTGNSRRSILGSSMGNLAAAYYGFPRIRFYSGGMEPSAFNPRTIRALEEIGFAVTPTGSEATRGELGTANPIYQVNWCEGLQTIEFSKHYAAAPNPKSDFAALMVCTEADTGCPVIPGASLQLSMPYDDPKMFDDGPLEASKYAERRDEIGRMMLAVMCEARRVVTPNHAQPPRFVSDRHGN